MRNRFAAPLFGLVLAVSLAFGVTSVFAQARQSDCLFDGRTFVGACYSDQHCTDLCIMYNGGYPNTRGECWPNGCCVCQL
jgi:hypothetical protein